MAARRTTMNIDHGLVAEAQQVLGTETATATVHAALAAVIRQFHLDTLADWEFPDLTLESIREGRATDHAAAEPTSGELEAS